MQQSWREMHAFAGVDLEDSRVTGWHFAMPPGRFVLRLEARVLPDGAPPCDRPAQLVFDQVLQIEGLHPTSDVLVQASDEAPRIDTPANFRRDEDGSYCFDAVWGVIRVHCSSIHFALEDAPRSRA